MTVFNSICLLTSFYISVKSDTPQSVIRHCPVLKFQRPIYYPPANNKIIL